MIIAITLLLMGHASSAYAKTRVYTDGDWEYSYKNDKITKTRYTGTDTSIVLPVSTVIVDSEYRISDLGTGTLEVGESVEEITIPREYKTLSKGAFKNCQFLKQIRIESDLGSLEKNIRAFAGAGSDKGFTVTFGDSVTHIPDFLFASSGDAFCHVTKAVLGSGITEIGEYAFSGCKEIKTVEIPDGSKLKSIQNNAFNGCTVLTGMNNKPVFKFPEGLTDIGFNAFRDCILLREVDFPSTLTLIENSAFYGCTGLNSVRIRSNLKKTSDFGIFYNAGTEAPAGITVVFSEGITAVPDNLFFTNWGTYEGKDYAHVKKVVLPSTLKKIGRYAFEDCFDLSDINISGAAALKTIGEFAFKGTGISKVSLPQSVKEIGDGAFEQCKSLTLFSTKRKTGTIGNDVFDRANEALVLKSYYGSWIDEYAGIYGIKSEYFAPDKVVIKSVTNGVKGIKIKWKKAKWASEYIVFRRGAGERSYIALATVKILSFEDTYAEDGKVYNYKIVSSAGQARQKGSSVLKICRLKRPQISSLDNKKGKKLEVSWYKTAAKGYILQYSTSSSMNKARQVKVNNKKASRNTISKTIKKLKKGKKYYIRIRAFKKSAGKTYYSEWSPKKKIKIRL